MEWCVGVGSWVMGSCGVKDVVVGSQGIWGRFTRFCCLESVLNVASFLTVMEKIGKENLSGKSSHNVKVND